MGEGIMVKSNLCLWCGKEVEAELLELGICVCRECAKKPLNDFQSEKVQDDNFVTVDGFNDRDSANKKQPEVFLGVVRAEDDVPKHEFLAGGPACNPKEPSPLEVEKIKREKRKKLLVRIGTITVLVLIAVLIGLGVAYII